MPTKPIQPIATDFDIRVMVAYYRMRYAFKSLRFGELLIILIIGKNGGVIRIRALAAALGFSYDPPAYNRVKRMMKKGLLVRHSKGHYGLSDTGASAYATAIGFIQPVLDEIRADVLRSLSSNDE